jgi:hypothetical protein
VTFLLLFVRLRFQVFVFVSGFEKLESEKVPGLFHGREQDVPGLVDDLGVSGFDLFEVANSVLFRTFADGERRIAKVYPHLRPLQIVSRERFRS